MFSINISSETSKIMYGIVVENVTIHITFTEHNFAHSFIYQSIVTISCIIPFTFPEIRNYTYSDKGFLHGNITIQQAGNPKKHV